MLVCDEVVTRDSYCDSRFKFERASEHIGVGPRRLWFPGVVQHIARLACIAAERLSLAVSVAALGSATTSLLVDSEPYVVL